MTDAALPQAVAQDCPRTLEEVSEYLARDRVPYDPVIEECPDCQNAMQALQRVSELSRELVASDARGLEPPPAAWFDAIVDSIRTELRAGRDLPLAHPDPRVRLTITEGAVRSLLRGVGDAVPGMIVGSCRIWGPAEVAGAPVRVGVTASVAWGTPIPPAVEELRARLAAALAEHTELNVTALDVRVEQVHGWEPNR